MLDRKCLRRAQFSYILGMTGSDQNHQQRRFPGWFIFIMLAVVMVALFPPGSVAEGQGARFIKSFLGLVVEALPFLLIGGLMAGVIEVLLPDSLLPTLGRRFGRLGLPVIALLSPILPLCECGVVGVGRGLLRKGLPVAHTVVYLLSAPILNPIVLFTTYLAFSAHPDLTSIVVFRALGGIVVPVIIGLLLWRTQAEHILLPHFATSLDENPSCGHHYAHIHSCDSGVPTENAVTDEQPTGACGHSHDSRSGPIRTFWRICASARNEFSEMATWFVVGIAIAAGLKTLFGTDAIGDAASDPMLGAPLMMLTAFVLSLCSEVDAFVAAAFPNASLSAITAFLVFGPMIDIRLMLLYRSVIKGRWVFAFAGLITISNLVFAWIIAGLFA